MVADQMSARSVLPRRVILGGAAGLVGAAILAACGGGTTGNAGGGNDPESAARSGFETWAKNVKIAYRNPSFKATNKQEAFATVGVTAEFQDNPTAPWIEREATVQVVKQRNQWQPPSDFRFEPTTKAVQTSQAVANATGTVAGQQSAATQVVVDQGRQATGTAGAISQQASATTASQATATGVVVAQATGTAQADQARSAQATTVASSTKQAASTATVVAQRTLLVNKPLTIEKIDYSEAQLRAAFAKVEYSLSSIVRTSDASIACTFSVLNGNAKGKVGISVKDASYILSPSGKKYNAGGNSNGSTVTYVNGVVAGERKPLDVVFNVPAAEPAAKLFMVGVIDDNDSSTSSATTWQALEIALP